MNKCVFCELVETGDNKNIEKNVILYEDDLILITQATGSPIRGYLMIIPKQHINGFAELNVENLKYVEKIANTIKILYQKYFGLNSILLEHGSTEKGRHPQSIVHAHIHLIPFNFNEETENELVSKLQLKTINSLEDIRANKKQDYWLYCNPSGKYYTSSNIADAPRSIFMNLIAKQINLKLPYEWRNCITNKEYIDEMIKIFKDNSECLQNINKAYYKFYAKGEK